MKKLSLFILILIFTTSLYSEPVSQDETKTENFKKFALLPVDESLKDPDFLKFITVFKKAIKDKNLEYLKNNTSKNIVWSFGDEKGGIRGFLKYFDLDRKNYREAVFWDYMDKILSLGGVYYNEEKTSFAFPYLFVTFPGGDFDIYSYAAVTGKNVNVRKSADRNSAVIETLDYEIVKILNPPDYDTPNEIIGSKSGAWVNILTASGRNGYIFNYYIHSPIGYRAIFEKHEGKWLLTAFISGD